MPVYKIKELQRPENMRNDAAGATELDFTGLNFANMGMGYDGQTAIEWMTRFFEQGMPDTAKALNLTNCRLVALENSELDSILSAIRTCGTRLTKITLTDKTFSIKGSHWIGDVLSNMPTGIKILDLSEVFSLCHENLSSYPSDDDWSLYDQRGYQFKLTQLILDSNFQDLSVRQVTKIFMNVPCAKELSLRKNGFGHRTAEDLYTIFANIPSSAEMLDLTGNFLNSKIYSYPTEHIGAVFLALSSKPRSINIENEVLSRLFEILETKISSLNPIENIRASQHSCLHIEDFKLIEALNFLLVCQTKYNKTKGAPPYTQGFLRMLAVMRSYYVKFPKKSAQSIVEMIKALNCDETKHIILTELMVGDPADNCDQDEGIIIETERMCPTILRQLNLRLLRAMFDESLSKYLDPSTLSMVRQFLTDDMSNEANNAENPLPLNFTSFKEELQVYYPSSYGRYFDDDTKGDAQFLELSQIIWGKEPKKGQPLDFDILALLTFLRKKTLTSHVARVLYFFLTKNRQEVSYLRKKDSRKKLTRPVAAPDSDLWSKSSIPTDWFNCSIPPDWFKDERNILQALLEHHRDFYQKKVLPRLSGLGNIFYYPTFSANDVPKQLAELPKEEVTEPLKLDITQLKDNSKEGFMACLNKTSMQTENVLYICTKIDYEVNEWGEIVWPEFCSSVMQFIPKNINTLVFPMFLFGHPTPFENILATIKAIPPHIKTLIFSDISLYKLSGKQLEQLFAAIPSTVESLDISNNGLGALDRDEYEISFFEIAPAFAALRVRNLDLSNNKLGCFDVRLLKFDKSIRSFCEKPTKVLQLILSNLSKTPLRKLNLSGNGFGDDDSEEHVNSTIIEEKQMPSAQLIEALRAMPHTLDELDLSDNNLANKTNRTDVDDIILRLPESATVKLSGNGLVYRWSVEFKKECEESSFDSPTEMPPMSRLAP